jgi:hypothetical protein
MQLNTDPIEPPRKPCIRDMHQLTQAPGALLPAALVMLTPLAELERRAEEISATHPQYREELPLVVGMEKHRRHRMRGWNVTVVAHSQTA